MLRRECIKITKRRTVKVQVNNKFPSTPDQRLAVYIKYTRISVSACPKGLHAVPVLSM